MFIIICSKMFFRKCQRPGCRNSCNNVRSSVKNFCTPACATAHQMSTSTVVVVQQQIPSSNKKQKAETTVTEIATGPPSTSQGYLNFSGLVWIADAYHKVASSRLSRFVAHSWIFKLCMKWKFDAYVPWPLAKRVQNWTVDCSTARNFTYSI